MSWSARVGRSSRAQAVQPISSSSSITSAGVLNQGAPLYCGWMFMPWNRRYGSIRRFMGHFSRWATAAPFNRRPASRGTPPAAWTIRAA